MKSAEEIMIGSMRPDRALRDGEVSGVSHHSVGRYVAAREAGRPVGGGGRQAVWRPSETEKAR